MLRLIISIKKFYRHCKTPILATIYRFSSTYSQYACEAYGNIWPIFGVRLIICRVLSAFPGVSCTWIALSRKPT